ncbi:MAG: phosphoenolpyruvate carboxykinase (GTP) [Clostridia bacterium]
MLKSVEKFVNYCTELMQPDEVVWITGDEQQYCNLREEACNTGEFIRLNQEKHPNCYLHRSARNDVARVEGRTFICCDREIDAGPTNHWMKPDDAYKILENISFGAMKGRTMYVIPYSMGDVSSPFAKIGIEVTDSIYVVISMSIMTRVGNDVLSKITDDFIRGLHTKAELSSEKRYICHFPQDNTIWSVNSGYGGNVLLGKKCFALRIASNLAKNEGWLAEHMLIVGITRPNEETKYIAAAFPSACGKTNLAMLVPPEYYEKLGYKVETIGDDIAWIRPGEDGCLYAINPEHGFFGVAPGTSIKTNPNALHSCKKDALFTNVALNTDDNTVWWEGLGERPEHLLDWQGDVFDPATMPYAAHPNSRFTAPIDNCPCLSSEYYSNKGVKISAFVFGGRRDDTIPLVCQAKSIEQGVFKASTMASQTTSAATGKVGVLRRDPFAMLPFFGYHVGDYFAHWLKILHSIANPPQIFNVNWFGKRDGKFVWAGFGENIRVLDWILDRCCNKVDAKETPIGMLPYAKDINVNGIDTTLQDVEYLLTIDKEKWAVELSQIEEFYAFIGERVPQALQEELTTLKKLLV